MGSDKLPTEKDISTKEFLDYIKNQSYMNHVQLDYFKSILEDQKSELILSISPKVNFISELSKEINEDDLSQVEAEKGISIRITDRQSKLLKKIDEALSRIEKGEYGYCMATGEEIGIARLLARPVTAFCIDEQERRDRNEKVSESYHKTETTLQNEYSEYDIGDVS
jgi:DnaK suppressor protein